MKQTADASIGVEIEKNTLPAHWKIVKLREVCKKVIGGGTPSTKIDEYWNGTIPWITSADIEGLRSLHPRKYITEEAIENSTTNILPEGGIIVVTRVGLGKLAIAPFNLCFSQDCQGLILDESLILKDYALWFLSKAVQIFKYESRGTTISGVTKKQLTELSILLPPLAEQRAIVAKIEDSVTHLANAIKELNSARQKLKLYRQSVLKYAFEGKFTINAQFKEVKLGDACKTTSGGTPSRKNPDYYKGDILWVKSGELNYNLIIDTEEKITAEAIKNSSAKTFPPGTLLIALYGATIGKLAILGKEAATNQAICGIFENEHVHTMFLYWFLFFKRPELVKEGVGGAQPNISQDILRKQIIHLPALAEQKQIVFEIEKRLSAAAELEKAVEAGLKKAELLRQSILKKAFEGRLEI